jgi:hypothetical protein
MSEALQQHLRKPMVLVRVSHDEGHLGHSVVVEPVVATDSDELCRALDNQGHSVLAVNLGEMCDFAWAQFLVWIAIAHPNGPRREVAVESHQGFSVG